VRGHLAAHGHERDQLLVQVPSDVLEHGRVGQRLVGVIVALDKERLQRRQHLKQVAGSR